MDAINDISYRLCNMGIVGLPTKILTEFIKLYSIEFN